MAANKYKKIIEFLEHEISLKGEKDEERKTILQAGRLNLAMCSKFSLVIFKIQISTFDF